MQGFSNECELRCPSGMVFFFFKSIIKKVLYGPCHLKFSICGREVFLGRNVDVKLWNSIFLSRMV